MVHTVTGFSVVNEAEVDVVLELPCFLYDPTAAAKSLRLCPTLCDPIDGSPPGSPIPGILQATTLEWVAISFSMIQQILEIWSLVPLPFPNPAWTSESSWITYCWSPACKILNMTLPAWEISATVWWLEYSSILLFLGIGMRIDLFQSCGHSWVLQICWHVECNTLMASTLG